jgi:hypothetical protein
VLPRGSDGATRCARVTIAVGPPPSFFSELPLRFQPCGVIHVLTAQPAEQRKNRMTTFTIDTHNNITAHATPEDAVGTITTPI